MKLLTEYLGKRILIEVTYYYGIKTFTGVVKAITTDNKYYQLRDIRGDYPQTLYLSDWFSSDKYPIHEITEESANVSRKS